MNFGLFLQKKSFDKYQSNAEISIYAYPASQMAINTALAKQNTSHFKHSLQSQNVKYFVGRETQFFKPNFPAD